MFIVFDMLTLSKTVSQSSSNRSQMVKRRNETAENEKVRTQRANYSDCVLNVKKCNVTGTVVLRLFCSILIRDISVYIRIRQQRGSS